jgi:hypothetical protein
LGDDAEASDAAPSPMPMPMPFPRAAGGLEERVARLEREVAQLRAALGDDPGEEQQVSYTGPTGEAQVSHTGSAEEQSSFAPPTQGVEHSEAVRSTSPEGEEEVGADGADGNEAEERGETLEWT